MEDTLKAQKSSLKLPFTLLFDLSSITYTYDAQGNRNVEKNEKNFFSFTVLFIFGALRDDWLWR